MILRARRPPATSNAPAPRPNKEAVPATPPVFGSSLASALAAGALAAAPPALASPALASALPALASALGPAAALCWICCVHSAVSAGVRPISLPVRSMSSALETYWRTPCSFKTCPVWTACWSAVHRLALLPVFLTSTFGVAVPLLFLASENSWETGCAIAGAATTSAIDSIATNSINFFNFFPSLSLRNYSQLSVHTHLYLKYQTLARAQ